MNKEEILSEYFLVETEKTEEMKGWKVVGMIDGCSTQSASPLLELKTDGDGWLCDFKVKLLGCGFVLCSPEYVIDEDELVMEAMEKVWNAWGAAQQLQEIIDKQLIQEDWNKIVTEPYLPSWTTSTPYINNPNNYNWSTTITLPVCSNANALETIDYSALANTASCPTSAANDYATAYATACSYN